ncbi:adenine phosphoribosyltransferase [Dawidia soli]|uniref:Adenine phosphoribosyltransferase n=1 Tax=Dawidia soli TaxID=2782352 RepID=A0AAP2DED9_9BACT|nr:adenine phosphoribosyltransferase [Dawidia soli]MBT1687852.1 adenine phosphoribosyltransferase [Dawidia soli]
MQLSDKIKHTIRDVRDYPKPGVVFKDITPILADPLLMNEMITQLKTDLKDLRLDAIAAVEARGFIFGAILAHALNCRFIPIRKAGKLPYKTVQQEYSLEYGTAAIEMHEDALQPGWRVLVHDDVLATGGTAGAAANLVRHSGAELAGFSFIINLSFLPGELNLLHHFGVKPQYLVTY